MKDTLKTEKNESLNFIKHFLLEEIKQRNE